MRFPGRIARFGQLNFSPDEVYMYLLLDFAELFRLGYNLGIVQTSWGKSCPDPTLLDIGIQSIIPIGGPVSGAVLDAVLSIDEHLFDKFGWVAFSKDLGLKGHRELWLSIVRYVDDIFIATRWFCPDCVPYIVSSIYSKTVVPMPLMRDASILMASGLSSF